MSDTQPQPPNKKGRWDTDSSEEDKDRIRKRAKKDRDRTGPSSKNAKVKVEKVDSQKGLTHGLLDAMLESPIALCRPSLRCSVDRRCRSIECYERLNYIDEGTYGMVFRAKCKQSGEIYAIKQVKLGPLVGKLGFPTAALREINALMSLKHPNIIPMREMVVGTGSDKIFMVMEYCENDLKTVMKLNQQSFSTAEIKRLMLQLLSAISYIHQRGYLHRDLKTSNLLYSNCGRLYVCDFGLARKYEM